MCVCTSNTLRCILLVCRLGNHVCISVELFVKVFFCLFLLSICQVTYLHLGHSSCLRSSTVTGVALFHYPVPSPQVGVVLILSVAFSRMLFYGTQRLGNEMKHFESFTKNLSILPAKYNDQEVL